MSSAWLLLLTGVPRLRAAAAPARELPLSRKDAAWLAVVARGGGVASRQAAQRVWPEADERGALNNLRQRVHRLRRASGARLVEMGEHIALADDLAEPRVDLAALLQRDPEAAFEPLLAGHEYDAEAELAAWLAQERDAQRAAWREALARHTAAAEREGALALALRCAQRLVALEPLSEHAHRRLMRLHYLRGDAAAAVAAFEDCERVLKDELGLRPGAETLQLLATIEQGRAGAAPAAQPAPASLSRPPRLVGRDAVLAALAEAEHAARVCVLVGEAGMGKSRVLQEALAGRGDALLAQARPGDASVPYAALARLLRALRSRAAGSAGALVLLGAEPGPASRTPTTPQALQAALESVLADAAAAGLALVAADDLHFADPASVEMLLALTQSDALGALRWVLAHRPLQAAPGAAPLQALAGAPQARFVALQPLDAAQLDELVRSLALPRFDAAALVPALLRHTGGNPLFVVETLRAAWARGDEGALVLPRPQALAHVIDERLARLSRPALALARVAAVAVPDFSLELAERVLDAPALALADAWQELEAAQVLRGEAFAHDLVHDAMRRATPGVIAAHTHRRVAAFLAGRGAEPARVAAHWQAGAAWPEAAAAYRLAAERAELAGRMRERAQLLQAAAAAFDAAGDADTAFDLRCSAVGALLSGEGAEAALALSQRLVDEADAQAAPARSARALAALAEVFVSIGRFADSEAAGRRALVLAAAGDEATRLQAAAAAAQSCGLQGRPDDGLALLTPWSERIATLPDPELRNGAAGALVNLLIQADQQPRALPWHERRLRWAQEDGDLGRQVSAHMDLGAHLLRCGELDAAAAHARRAAALALAADEARGQLAWNQTGLAFMLCGLGQYAEGLALFEAELARSEAQPGTPLHLLQQQWLAPVWLQLGQTARAARLLADDHAVPAPQFQARRALMRALVARAGGGDDRPLLQQALAGLTAPVARFDWIGARLLLARHAAPQQALEAADELAPMAEARAYRAVLADVEALRVWALQALGRGDAAAAAAARLEALALRWRYPTQYLPEQMLAAAAGWRAGGCEDDARRCEAAALHWLHSVALPQVPAPFVDSFLNRNPVNVALRAALARRLRA